MLLTAEIVVNENYTTEIHLTDINRVSMEVEADEHQYTRHITTPNDLLEQVINDVKPPASLVYEESYSLHENDNNNEQQISINTKSLTIIPPTEISEQKASKNFSNVAFFLFFLHRKILNFFKVYSIFDFL